MVFGATFNTFNDGIIQVTFYTTSFAVFPQVLVCLTAVSSVLNYFLACRVPLVSEAIIPSFFLSTRISLANSGRCSPIGASFPISTGSEDLNQSWPSVPARRVAVRPSFLILVLIGPHKSKD